MKSAKFSKFFSSPPPYLHFHATSLTELPYFVCFSRTPPPLERGRYKWKIPNAISSFKDGFCVGCHVPRRQSHLQSPTLLAQEEYSITLPTLRT